jgi:hypothetical protein
MHRTRAAGRAAVAILMLSGAARAEERPEVIDLRWSWPPGTTHTIDGRTIVSMTGSPSQARSFRSRTRIARTADGWRIDLTSLTPDGVAGAEREGPPSTYAISREARFARVEPLARKLTSKPGIPELAPEKAASLMAALDAARENGFRDAWDLEEGFWNGKRLEVGRWYETVQEAAAVPDLEHVRVPHEVSYRIEGRVPCGLEPGPARCVRLVLRAKPQPSASETLAAALAGLRVGVGAAVPEDVLRSAVREREIVTVADPSTLFAHRTVKTTRIRATVTVRGTETRVEGAIRDLATATTDGS